MSEEKLNERIRAHRNGACGPIGGGMLLRTATPITDTGGLHWYCPACGVYWNHYLLTAEPKPQPEAEPQPEEPEADPWANPCSVCGAQPGQPCTEDGVPWDAACVHVARAFDAGPDDRVVVERVAGDDEVPVLAGRVVRGTNAGRLTPLSDEPLPGHRLEPDVKLAANVVRLPLPQGTRVRIVAEHRPPAPHDVGVIWKHRPECGGYLVQHDSSPFSDGTGPGPTLFGWTYDEVEPIKRESTP